MSGFFDTRNRCKIAGHQSLKYSNTMSLAQDSRNSPEAAKGGLHAPVDPWEEAYLRFERPEQEVQKFLKRLRRLGAAAWPREMRIVELFCGRGNSLLAWEQLGFRNLEGVDLSPRLIAKYDGPAKCYVADCRHLPFADASKDAAVVQGGLHHLLKLPEDLEQTFAEIRRVLTSDGRVLFVEAWRTPFLNFVHCLSEQHMVRRLSAKFDALATMIEHERQTYEQWLNQPQQISALAHKHFVPLHESFAWGKWNFVGKPRAGIA
jgi:SAM-dependent methyltransferase